MGRKHRVTARAWSKLATTGSAMLLSAATVFALPAAQAQSTTPLVAPCMKDGKPCRAPGPWTPGNLNLPLPFGIYYNSMSSPRPSDVGQSPYGFFGPGMSFPFGYIELKGGVPYAFLPDGSEVGFVASGSGFKSEYEAVGDLTTISPTAQGGVGYDLVRPDGTTVVFSWRWGLQDKRYYPTAVKDVDGHATYTISYLQQPWLFTVTDALGLQTKFTSHSADDKKVGSIRLPDGAEATINYNAQGRLSSIEFLGQTTTLTYDATGNVTRFRVQKGTQTDTIDYFYNSGLLSDIIDGDANSTSLLYARDSVTSVSGKAGTVKGYARTIYTTVNGSQMVARQEVGQGATSNPATVMWSASYNTRGLPTSITDNMGRVTAMEYGVGPFPTKVTNPDGSVDTFTYANAANKYRLTSVVSTAPDGKQSSETLTWSGAKLASRTRVVDGAQVLRETYSSSATAQSVTSTATETYSYDSAGRIVSMKGPGGRTSTTFANGKVSSISDNGVQYGITTSLSDTGTRTVGINGGGIAASFETSFTGRSRSMSVGDTAAKVVTTMSSSVSGSATNSTRSSSYSVVNGTLMDSGSSSSTTTVDAKGVARTTGSSN